MPNKSLARLEREFLDRNENLKRLLINSVPKSGTTWMRTMLAMLPQYEEYPREEVSGLEPSQLLGVDPGQIFHGHLMSSERLFEILESLDFSTVFVYRDLRDVVVSDYFHRVGLNPQRTPPVFGDLPKEELLRPGILEQWCGSVKRYPDVQVWIDRGFPTVRYEDLVANVAAELERVLSQMGLDLPAGLAESIAERSSFRHQSGRAPGQEDVKSPLRKGIVGDWKNHFTDSAYDEFMSAYGHLLERYGYVVDESDRRARK